LVLTQSRAIAVFFPPSILKSRPDVQLQWFLRHRGKIEEAAGDANPGSCLYVQANGNIERRGG